MQNLKGYTFQKFLEILLNIDDTELKTYDREKQMIKFKDTIFICGNEFEESRRLVNDLYKKYELINFMWDNKSYSRIGDELFKIVNGINGLPNNYYNKEVMKINGKTFKRSKNSSCKYFYDIIKH